MVRLKLGEAIRLINERDKKTQKTITKEAQKKKRMDAYRERKEFWEQYKLEKNIQTIPSIDDNFVGLRGERKLSALAVEIANPLK